MAEQEVWVYLDSNVLIDFSEALGGSWVPPDPLDEPRDIRRVAAARLILYSGCRGWVVAATSTEARKEGLRGLALELLDPLIVEVDELNGSPTDAEVQELIARYTGAGLKLADATHAAQCASRPQFRFFVTSDTGILNKAPVVETLHQLEFVTPSQAVERMALQPGETPEIQPSESNPSASSRLVDPVIPRHCVRSLGAFRIG